jgi:hypothetical protein
VDRDDRQMIAAITAPARVRPCRPGSRYVSIRCRPPGGAADGIGVLVDVNWQNTGRKPRRAVKVALRGAKRGTVRRLAHSFAERGASWGSRSPPCGPLDGGVDRGAERRAPRCAAGARRVAAGLGRVPADARPRCTSVPASSPRTSSAPTAWCASRTGDVGDPFDASRRHFYGALDYTDPGLRLLLRPELVRAARASTTSAGTTTAPRALRFGCEETAGVSPGVAAGLPGGGPAKPCATGADCFAPDPAYPGRTFTGACVPANLVAGPSVDDEVCGVTGTYYDAVPGAAPGAECDVSTLPPIAQEGTR